MLLNIFLSLLLFLFGNTNNDLAVSQIDTKLLENANAVIRYANSDITISKIDKVQIVENKAITVMNEKGKSYADLVIYFRNKVEKVKNIKITILDKHGELVRKVSKKEIQNNAYSDNFSLAGDYRYYYFEHEQNDYPYTITYSYEKQSPNTFFITPWLPLPSYGVSVESSTYKAQSLVPDQVFLFDTINTSGCEIDIKNDQVNYSLENSPALKHETHSPHYLDYLPFARVVPSHFSYFGFEGNIIDWESYGKWMYSNMLEGRGTLPEELIRELKALIPANASNDEKARIIYNYVTNNTRYVSIQLGIGGHRPFPSEDVYNLKYGDCKALSYYTKNILEEFGIEAIYTEIKSDSDDESGYKTDVPGIGQGNHIILCLPEIQDTVFLECTANVPFAYMPSSTSGRNALLVKEDGGVIVETPRYKDEENLSILHAKFVIEDNFGTSIEWNAKHYNQRYRDVHWIESLQGKKRDRYLKKYLFRQFSSPEITDFSTELVDQDICQIESANIKSKSMIEKAGYYMMIPLNFTRIEIPTKIGFPRENSIYIKDGKKDSIYIEIPLNNKFISAGDPVDIDFDNVFGKIDIEQETLEDKIIIKGYVLYKSGKFENIDVLQHILFREQIVKFESTKVTLKSKDP